MSARQTVIVALAALMACLAAGPLAAPATASGLPGGAEWSLEQPSPPARGEGGEGGEESVGVPIGLGKIGDVEFWAPNRGALITAGNGSTVKPGVWLYNGDGWHPLTAQTPEEGICGASDGRIAWAGPDEFWTVSNGRPGQAPESKGNLPSLVDDSLCHFTALNPKGEPLEHFEVVKSYATLGFETTSYQAMHAAACTSASDCWFGGSPLPAPYVESFQLHWNGSTVSREPYKEEAHAVEDMQSFEGAIYESLRVSPTDLTTKQPVEIPVLHRLGETGAGEPILGMDEDLYGEGENPFALDYLRLSASGNALWAAAGSEPDPPASPEPAGVTVLRYSREQYSSASGAYEEASEPSWQQVIGPETVKKTKVELFPEEVVSSIAAEPGTHNAWVALEPQIEASGEPNPLAHATLALVSGEGDVLETLQLPDAKGIVTQIVCPAAHDCWAASAGGWLYHLATAAERAAEAAGRQAESEEHWPSGLEAAFRPDYVVTYRPPDEGVPLQTSTALPVDDSGLSESRSGLEGVRVEPVAEEQFARVALPLLSHEHTRLRHGTELELSFHLAVKARVRLLAERKHEIVASTPTRTLQAGNRSLLLQLNAKRWPTKLNLQSHALAPLPTASTRENNSATNTVSYGLSFPDTRALEGSSLLGSGLLP
jgi:hypothetical protein